MKVLTKVMIVCCFGIFCFSNLVTANEEAADDKPKIEKIKAISVECEKPVEDGFYGVPSLSLEEGQTTVCTLMLDYKVLGLADTLGNKFTTNLKTTEHKIANVSPEEGETDGNGRFRFTVTAKKKGSEWIAWCLPNEKGEFEFTKDNYRKGLAFGMFVKVKK